MQASPRPHAKYRRLEARITESQKVLFQHAADLLGRSLTDFIVSVLQEAANRTIREHDVLQLSLRDQQAFAAALSNPPKPNKVLKAALKRYQKEVKK